MDPRRPVPETHPVGSGGASHENGGRRRRPAGNQRVGREVVGVIKRGDCDMALYRALVAATCWSVGAEGAARLSICRVPLVPPRGEACGRPADSIGWTVLPIPDQPPRRAHRGDRVRLRVHRRRARRPLARDRRLPGRQQHPSPARSSGSSSKAATTATTTSSTPSSSSTSRWRSNRRANREGLLPRQSAQRPAHCRRCCSSSRARRSDWRAGAFSANFARRDAERLEGGE